MAPEKLEITEITGYTAQKLIKRVRAAINRQHIEESGMPYTEVRPGVLLFSNPGYPDVEFILSTGKWLRHSDPKKLYPEWGANSFLNWYRKKLFAVMMGLNPSGSARRASSRKNRGRRL